MHSVKMRASSFRCLFCGAARLWPVARQARLPESEPIWARHVTPRHLIHKDGWSGAGNLCRSGGCMWTTVVGSCSASPVFHKGHNHSIWPEDTTAQARIMCLGPNLADELMLLHCLESCPRDPLCPEDLADWWVLLHGQNHVAQFCFQPVGASWLGQRRV